MRDRRQEKTVVSHREICAPESTNLARCRPSSRTRLALAGKYRASVFRLNIGYTGVFDGGIDEKGDFLLCYGAL